MISSLRISYLNACTNSCATFDSLNTGSLDNGAEKGKTLLAYESEFGGLFMVMNGIVSRFLSMEIYMGLLGSWAGDSGIFIVLLVDGNVISLQQMEFRAIVINIKPLKITALINSVLVLVSILPEARCLDVKASRNILVIDELPVEVRSAKRN